MTIKTIDITTSWRGLVGWLMYLLEHECCDVNDKSERYYHEALKSEVRAHFEKMARAADAWNEHCKELKENQS